MQRAGRRRGELPLQHPRPADAGERLAPNRSSGQSDRPIPLPLYFRTAWVWRQEKWVQTRKRFRGAIGARRIDALGDHAGVQGVYSNRSVTEAAAAAREKG
jgi:hypothetical protein